MSKPKNASISDAPRVVELPPPGTGKATLKALGGSVNDDFNNVLAHEVLKSLWTYGHEKADIDKLYRAALAALGNSNPNSEIEGMLIAQMIACHHAAMDCYRRAMIGEQTFAGRQQNLNFAVKLSRTYALHLEALNKLRGKGQQKVTVEHVHVHQGGQAIVGTVTTGGSATNSGEQAHAHTGKPIAHSQEQALPGARAADREAVPIASDG